MRRLEETTLSDDTAAASNTANLVKQVTALKVGIESYFDTATGLYSYAKHPNGTFQRIDPSLTIWYPDTQAQTWPGIWGVENPTGRRHKVILDKINAAWGRGNRDWSRRIVPLTKLDATYPSAWMGYSALLTQDRSHHSGASRQASITINHLKSGKPWVISDIGWLLALLHGTQKP